MTKWVHSAFVRPIAMLAALAGFLILTEGSALSGPNALQDVQDDVARRWPALTHLPAEKLTELMAANAVALFDVREEAEYQVSHIPGAVRIDPGITREDFMARFGTAAKDKNAVFYCSVGVRSSKLATRVAEDLKAGGARAVYDLAGGIFAWHRDERPLTDAKGPTQFVHPNSKSWGSVLSRPDLLRMEPR